MIKQLPILSFDTSKIKLDAVASLLPRIMTGEMTVLDVAQRCSDENKLAPREDSTLQFAAAYFATLDYVAKAVRKVPTRLSRGCNPAICTIEWSHDGGVEWLLKETVQSPYPHIIMRRWVDENLLFSWRVRLGNTCAIIDREIRLPITTKKRAGRRKAQPENPQEK